MRKNRKAPSLRGLQAAQRLVSATTTPKRAAAIIGDLTEQMDRHGEWWFWLAVARIATANIYQFLRHPQTRTLAMTETPRLLITMWRRKYVVLACTLAAAAVASAIAMSRSSLYRSTAILAAESSPGAGAPASAIRGTLERAFDDRTLESILRDVDATRITVNRDSRAAVRRMRNDIRVEMLSENAFQVGYTSTNPHIAQQVNIRLAAAVIEEHRRHAPNATAAAALRNAISLVANRESIGEATLPADELSISGEIELFGKAAPFNPREVRVKALSLQLSTKEPVGVNLQLSAKEPGGIVLAELLQGSTMRLVSTPTLPTSPYAPDRRRLVVTGAFGGFVVGLLLAGTVRRRPQADIE